MLTDYEKQLVETHMYIISSVIVSSIGVNESIQGLGYDDLYQTGCVALCNAAKNYKDDRKASFATFARVVVRNALISHCRSVNRMQNPLLYLDAPITDDSNTTFADTMEDTDFTGFSDVEVYYMLSEAEKHLSGISKKGIQALKLKYMGLTGNEIAKVYGVNPNHVAAWITRAVYKLKADASIAYP